jgi:uncharacterized membrane protein
MDYITIPTIWFIITIIVSCIFGYVAAAKYYKQK